MMECSQELPHEHLEKSKGRGLQENVFIIHAHSNFTVWQLNVLTRLWYVCLIAFQVIS